MTDIKDLFDNEEDLYEESAGGYLDDWGSGVGYVGPVLGDRGDVDGVFSEDWAGYIKQVARNMSMNEELLDDVVGEVYLQMQRDIEVNGREVTYPKGYVATNTKWVVNNMKKYHKNKTVLNTTYSEWFDGGDLSNWDASGLKDLVDKIVKNPKFKEKDLKIMSMLYEGYTHQEIADSMGKQKGAITQRIHRIRNYLKDDNQIDTDRFNEGRTMKRLKQKYSYNKPAEEGLYDD